MSIDPRQTGTFNFNANFEVGIQGPMDARQLCPTFDDRAALEYTYQGMLCVVTRDEERAGGSAANNGVYVRINDPVSTGRTPESPTVDSDWELIGGGAGDPVEAFIYFTTQEQITAAVENNDPEAEATINTIDLSGESVAVTTGQIVIESGTNYTDFTSDFDGNYIVSDTGTLLLCSVDDYDAASFTTTITFDGEADPATDFNNSIPVTSSTLELNDLVIRLQSGNFFKVNIQGGSGGSGRYNPDKAGEPWAVTPQTQVPNTIGGITQGTTAQELDDMPFSQVWNKLLFPAQLPSVGAPNAALNGAPNDYYYVGETVSVTFEPTLTSLGSITVSPQGPAGVQPAPSTGLNSATFAGPGYTDPPNILPDFLPDSATIGAKDTINISTPATLGKMEWVFTYDFEGGPIPKDSQGNDVPARQLSTPNPIPPGSKKKACYGTYPIFVGTDVDGQFEDASQPSTVNYKAGTTRPTKANFYSGGPFHFSQGWNETDPDIKHRCAIPTIWTGSLVIKQIDANGSAYLDIMHEFDTDGTRTDLFGGIEYTIYKKNTGTTLAKGDAETAVGSQVYVSKFTIEY